jgi:hypothetical protein
MHPSRWNSSGRANHTNTFRASQLQRGQCQPMGLRADGKDDSDFLGKMAS